MPQIKTIETAGGQQRCCPRCSGTGKVAVKGSRKYRFTVDVGRGPGGKRQQRTYTFDRLEDAKAELARITHTVHTGEFVDRSKMTVSEMCDNYLASKSFRTGNTRSSYRNALKPARDRLGGRLARSVERQDVQQLVSWMLTHGRRRGGKPGTGLSRRSAELTLGRLAAAFDLAIRDRKVPVNPCTYVELPDPEDYERDTWSAPEVRTFLDTAASDRLHAAWRLTLYGLRRGEVLGLRWDDKRLPKRLKGTPAVDLENATITIGWTRVMVDSQVTEKGPKSENGYRTLPLDDADVAALRALRKRQLAERLAAGEAYTDSGWVVTDEVGEPVHPEWYSDEFHRVREHAGLRRIRLHDSRHTANSLMAAANVPDHIRAAWCGHTVTVNVATYTHARPEDLEQAAAALSKIHNAV